MSIMDLKKNAPKGEFLAYINKKEAAMLKKAGGSGELVNGIPSFRPQDMGNKENQAVSANNPGIGGLGAGRTDGGDHSGDYSSKTAAKEKAKYEKQFGGVSPTGSRPMGFFARINKYNTDYQKKANIKLAQKRYHQLAKKLGKYVHGDMDMDYDFTQDIYGNKISKGLENLISNKGTSIESTRPNLYSINSDIPGVVGSLLNKSRPDTQVTLENTKNLMRDYRDLSVDPNISREKLEELANRGKTPEQINPPSRDGDGPQPYLPIDYNTGAATTEVVEPYTNDFEYRFGDKQNVGADVTQGFYAANGGRITRAGGGIMNAVPRQGYFLGGIGKAVGKVVGGVAKAAGKVLSSDVGKAAIIGAGIYYGGGGRMPFTDAFKAKGFGGFSLTGPGSFFSKSNPLLFKADKTLSLGKILGLSAALPFLTPPAKPNEDIGMGDRGGSLIDPITGQPAKPAEMRASLNDAIENADGDPDKIAAIEQAYAFLPPIQELGQYYPYQTYGAANGGRIGYGLGNLVKRSSVAQPVSASMNAGDKPIMSRSGMGGMLSKLINNNSHLFKNAQNNNNYLSTAQNVGADVTRGSYDFIDENMNGIDDREETFMAKGGRIRAEEGGLMNLGGMEKDYRAEGGFVPIGKQEKADDVPARLSVNEFVFTADAVRNAGGGDIDKGAEVMENMMKNLENGGRVSEESQGNTGAQDMFSVSERIGEVI